MNNFVHLHVHTDYSVLDGASKSQDYAKLAKYYNMPGLAITDHGNLMGWINHYNVCKEYNIKPIFGVEAYILENPEFYEDINKKIAKKEQESESLTGTDKTKARAKLKELKAKKKNEVIINHIVLLAKNIQGFKNIIKISSEAYLNRVYRKPLTTYDIIRQNKEGIILLTACVAGRLPQLILADEFDKANEYVQKYKKEFGDDFYIELEPNDIKEQFIVNKELVKIANNNNVQCVITNDCHYSEKQDYDIHNKLLLLQTKATVQDIDDGKDVFQFSTQGFYLKNYDDIVETMKTNHYEIHTNDILKACENTIKIYDKIDQIDIKKEKIFPKFECEDSIALLREECLKGWNRIEKQEEVKDNIEEYQERLKYEFDIIKKFGFADYFLIVQDIIQQHYKEGYICGPGRGSVGGSLIAYLLGITTIDPIKYDLYFERFLNPQRIKIPDIDIDFENRDKAQEYIQNKYGKEYVAPIVALQRLKTRNLIRDISRVLNIPLNEADRVAKDFYSNETIEDGYERSCNTMGIKVIKDFFDKYPDVRTIANKLYDQVRNISRHASGIVVTSEPMYNHIPMLVTNNMILTQWEMSALDQIGALKIDVLGLNNLSIIHKTIDLIKEKRNIEIDIDNIDLENKELLNEFSQGKTLGIFQFESEGMVNLLRSIKPNSFNDIIAANALYRPAALISGFAYEYGKRKRSGKFENYHKDFDEILSQTHGILVYQEQFMYIVKQITGMSLGEADLLRRELDSVAVTKEEKIKKARKINKIKDLIIEKGSQKKYSLEMLEKLWKSLEGVGQYAFNKSHATAYAKIAMQTMYLKYYYPLEYFSVLLSSLKNVDDKKKEENKIEKAVKDSKKYNIEILPLDVRYSKTHFDIQDDRLRYSLSLIKGISETSADIISNNQDKFTNFVEFYKNVIESNARIINKRVVDALILSGACDNMPIGLDGFVHHNRADILNCYYYLKGDVNKSIFDQYYFNNRDKFKIDYDKKKKSSLKQVEILRDELNNAEMINLENEYCGFLTSVDLFDINNRRERIRKMVNYRTKYLSDFTRDQDSGCAIVYVASKHEMESKKSGGRKKYYIVYVSDEHGNTAKCMLFGQDKLLYETLRVADRIYILRLSFNAEYNNFNIKKLEGEIE